MAFRIPQSTKCDAPEVAAEASWAGLWQPLRVVCRPLVYQGALFCYDSYNSANFGKNVSIDRRFRSSFTTMAFYGWLGGILRNERRSDHLQVDYTPSSECSIGRWVEYVSSSLSLTFWRKRHRIPTHPHHLHLHAAAPSFCKAFRRLPRLSFRLAPAKRMRHLEFVFKNKLEFVFRNKGHLLINGPICCSQD